MNSVGWKNVLYVAFYRITLKTKMRKWILQGSNLEYKGSFFKNSFYIFKYIYGDDEKKKLIKSADNILSGQFRYFAHDWKTVGIPPDWFFNPYNEKKFTYHRTHWVDLKDFGEVGDIKNVWEASRYEWVYTLSRAYMASGEQKYIDFLNYLLADWHEKNPLNIGPNWKCGQETSIRVFALLNSSLMMGLHKTPSESLLQSIYLHSKRVYGNIDYAIAQDNNHGTSEAAALFIAGNWLYLFDTNESRKKQALKWARTGRKVMEERIRHLVSEEGTFSQYSVNYHRVVLDTVSFVEVWRREMDLEPFTPIYKEKIAALTTWMLYFTDLESGEAANIGANDGAMLLCNHNCDYRDFRPSCQLASYLFHNKLYFPLQGSWNEPLFHFRLEIENLSQSKFVKKNRIIDNSYLIMVQDNSWAILRLPNFQFRPNHNDVFHFDMHYNGKNIFLDSGSYSYNPGKNYKGKDLKSVQAHNTVAFGSSEQMPRISKFLLGNWISMHEMSEITLDAEGNRQWSGSYHDYKGNFHKRTISWNSKNEWNIIDEFNGNVPEVFIGYNLLNTTCTIKENELLLPYAQIIIVATASFSLEVMDHEYSLRYWNKTQGKRFVIRTNNNNKVTTLIKLL